MVLDKLNETEGEKAGCRAVLPTDAEQPFAVFINGVQQAKGTDYHVRGNEILFTRAIVKEGKLPAWRWAAIWLGLFGSYKRNETVDVQYRRGGSTELASDVEILP